jgi:hypothetical protein
MRTWVYDPHSGGVSIPKSVQERTRSRILAYAEAHHDGRYIRLEIRFRGAFCYIDAYVEPHLTSGWPPPDWPETREEMAERLRNTPTHLCRLRYFGNEEAWSFAFFAYSSGRYEPAIFANGTWTGTPEEAFECSSIYLDG